jgi:hypothetical protein
VASHPAHCGRATAHSVRPSSWTRSCRTPANTGLNTGTSSAGLLTLDGVGGVAAVARGVGRWACGAAGCPPVAWAEIVGRHERARRRLRRRRQDPAGPDAGPFGCAVTRGQRLHHQTLIDQLKEVDGQIVQAQGAPSGQQPSQAILPLRVWITASRGRSHPRARREKIFRLCKTGVPGRLSAAARVYSRAEPAEGSAYRCAIG